MQVAPISHTPELNLTVARTHRFPHTSFSTNKPSIISTSHPSSQGGAMLFPRSTTVTMVGFYLI